MYLSLHRTIPAILVLASLFAPVATPAQARTLQELLASAQTEQQAGHYAAAASLFRRATVLSPNTAELWSNRGLMEYLAHQQDAAASLKHALRLNPNLFVSLLFLGKTSLDGGRPAEALPYLQHAGTLQPADPQVLLTLGQAHALLGHSHEASSSYAALVAVEPSDATAWLGLGKSSLEAVTQDGRSLSSVAPQSAWARSLYADELLAQGRPLEAIDVYQAAITSATTQQRTALARTLQVTQAKPEQFPLPDISQSALGKLLAQLQPALAVDSCDAGTATSASPLPAAACSYWSGDYERSAALASLALRQTPQDPEALYWSIKANERLAVGALSRVDDLAPDSVTMHVLVGDLYREQRQSDGAAVEYNKALALDPHNVSALLGVAAAYFANNKLEDAADAAKKALAEHPADPQLNLLTAEILGAQGRETEARPFLAKCSGIALEFQARVHYLLGRAAAAENDLPEAIHQFQLALPGDQDGKTHYQLSRLYRKTGDVAKAKQAEAEAKSLVDRRDAKAATVVREATGTSP